MSAEPCLHDVEYISILLREYDASYRYIDVRGKVVLDIGADFGTSAFWFIAQGAQKVIAYDTYQNRIVHPKIEWHGKWNGEFVPADVLKIDCEGCECLASPSFFEKYREAYIAIHEFAPCFNSLFPYLNSTCHKIFVTEDGKETMFLCRK